MQSIDPTLHVDSRLSDPDLRFYYERLFPIDAMVEWLTYEASNDAGPRSLARREFSVSLAADDGGEIYLRWLCFANKDAWMRKLIDGDRVPIKMDLGALYPLPLSLKDSQPHRFVPQQKEIVFDIDMNDYDHIRTCCSGKKICDKCWRFMTLAMRLMDEAFREDYGFDQILWVYSGRRGIHAWICDPDARRMNNQARVAMVNYLGVVNERASKGMGVKLFHRTTEKKKDEPSDRLTHPVMMRAREYCSKAWPQILRDQNVFSGTSEKAQQARTWLEEHLYDTSQLNLALQNMTQYDNTPEYSIRLWEALESTAVPRQKESLYEIAVGFTYPRLDVNVTKDVGHLLKSPFCAHPATGRVCVPIDPSLDGEDGRGVFQPALVPTVSGLRAEFRERNGLTSLKPYLDVFRTTFLNRLIPASTDKENTPPLVGSAHQHDVPMTDN